MLQPDSELPEFSMLDVVRVPFGREDLSGSWTILWWYPRAGTPGCTAQATGLRDQFDAFEELGCRIVGASFDSTDDNRSFRDEFHLPYTLLSDEQHEVGVLFGAAEDVTTEYPKRIAYLIDPDLRIRAAYDVVDPEFFAEGVLDDLERLIDQP